MSAKLKQVQFSDIREHFEEIRNWNSRINLNQLTKNEKSPGFEWWALIDGETWVAVAAVDTEGHENAIYGNEVMAKSGNGYGVKLIRALYDEYKSSGKDKFVFDAETNGSLADHYKKNFPDFDISESPWGTPRFTKHYKQQLKMKENSKITLTIGQLRKLVKEARIDPDSVMDGNEMVEKIIDEMKKVGDQAEQIAQMEQLLAKFSKKTVEKALAAKELSAAARAAVKADSKPLDQAAKQLADLIGADNNVFFSVKMKTERIGVLLTRASSELSYSKIVTKLTDPDFLEEHKKMQKLGKDLIDLLDKAKAMLSSEELKASWTADLYSQDPDTGDMQHLEEGFMDGIKDAFHKVVDWFGNVFNKLLPRKQEEYAVAAESYDGMLDSLLK